MKMILIQVYFVVNSLLGTLFFSCINLILKLNQRSTHPHTYFKIIFQLRKNWCSVITATAEIKPKRTEVCFKPGQVKAAFSLNCAD